MTGQTKLFFLSIYQATPNQPLASQSTDELLHRGRLQVLDLGWSTKPRTLLSNLHMPDGIAVSTRHDRIFWTNMGTPGQNDGTVLSANIDGSDAKSLLPAGAVNTPKQIVIDPKAEKLYFSDREGLRVHRCNLDGSEHEIIVQTGDWQNESHRSDQTRWCVGIAVSHSFGKIFWTQKGAPKSGQGRIFSAGIDVPEGSDANSRPDIEVVAEGLPEPIDLEIDEVKNALYWTDRGEFPFGNTLNTKTLNGPIPEAEQRLHRQILAEGFGEAIGLAIDKRNKCIWVADLCGRIWKCESEKPAPKQKMYEDETAVFTGLAVVRM